MVELIKLKENGDDRGQLVVVENNKQVPFGIARLFYAYNTSSDAIRGKHANRNSKFCFICLKGSVKIMTNDGYNENHFALEMPTQMLFMDEMVWKEMYDFSEDAVLLIISNCLYDKNEYIYDFDKFISEVRK